MTITKKIDALQDSLNSLREYFIDINIEENEYKRAITIIPVWSKWNINIEEKITLHDLLCNQIKLILKQNETSDKIVTDGVMKNKNENNLNMIVYRDKIEITQTLRKKVIETDPSLNIIDKIKKFDANKNSIKQKKSIQNVKKIIAITSGKGGVGKSTICSLLAQSLKRKGMKVAILDADIYGPSINIIHKIDANRADKFEPVISGGVKIQTIASYIEPNRALAWRGPMVSNAINQLLFKTNWGHVDVLLIDTPPGTGDAHLTLGRDIALDGVVVVSTGQYVAINDSLRSLALFKELKVKILGLVQNMSHIFQENNDKIFNLFGVDGVEKMAKMTNTDFMGNIPFFQQIIPICDRGLIDFSMIDKEIYDNKGAIFKNELEVIEKTFDELATKLLKKI